MAPVLVTESGIAPSATVAPATASRRHRRDGLVVAREEDAERTFGNPSSGMPATPPIRGWCSQA
jgi:hypothetical protein